MTIGFPQRLVQAQLGSARLEFTLLQGTGSKVLYLAGLVSGTHTAFYPIKNSTSFASPIAKFAKGNGIFDFSLF